VLAMTQLESLLFEIMDTLMSGVSGVLGGAGPFLILLGLLIFVHELGHFLVAKFFGVRVEVFSLGFGKKLLQYKWGDTNYCVSLIPLGGYVKMYGDDPTADIPAEQKAYSFLHKPVGPRIAIVLAGPLMNLFFAFFLFIVLGAVGEPQPAPQLGDISEASRAYQLGFRSGDRILDIDGQPIHSWLQARNRIENSATEKLHFLVERDASTERAEITATPVWGANENILSHKDQVGTIEGFELASLAPVVGVTGPDTIAAKAGLQTLDAILTINGRDVLAWRHLQRMIQEEVQAGRVPLKMEVQSYLSEGSPVRVVELNISASEDSSIESHGSLRTDSFAVAPPLEELGLENSQLYLWKIKKGSPAERAGLTIGDRIVSVNGKKIGKWSEVIDLVKDFNPDAAPISITYRRDGLEKDVELVPEMTELMTVQGKEEKRFTIGIVAGYIQSYSKPVIQRAHGVVELLSLGARRTWESTIMVVMSIVRLVNGVGARHLYGGVLGTLAYTSCIRRKKCKEVNRL